MLINADISDKFIYISSADFSIFLIYRLVLVLLIRIGTCCLGGIFGKRSEFESLQAIRHQILAFTFPCLNRAT